MDDDTASLVKPKSIFSSSHGMDNVPLNSKTAHPLPPGQTPGHLTFLKNLGQIPCHVASLDGQMPHPLELQRGSNPPPSRHVKATVLNFFSCVKPFISSSTSVPSSVTISTSTSEFKPSFSFPDANQIQ